MTRSKWLEVLGVVAVLALGTAVRLLGLGFGLPFHHHWDEPFLLDSVGRMLRQGNDVPLSYMYGAPLARLTVLGFRALRGLGPGPMELPLADAQVTLYRVARTVTALISASGVLAVYVAARLAAAGARGARAEALASALLYAVAWELVLHSRYGVTDACLVGLTAWTLALTAAYLATRRLAWGLAAVLAAGITFAFKLPGLLTVMIPAGALLATPGPASRRGAWSHRALLLAAVPLALGCYVALNPHLTDHTVEAVRDIAVRLAQTHEGRMSKVYRREPGWDHLRSALWVITSNFLHRQPVAALGLTAVAAGGLAAGLVRPSSRVLVALALGHAALATLADALSNRTFLVRNYIVVVPCLCLGFGAGVVGLVRLAASARTGGPRAARVIGVGLSLAVLWLLVALPLGDALAAEHLKGDPRTLAIDWIAARARASAPVDVAFTWSVLGTHAVGEQPNLRAELARPGVRVTTDALDACPDEPLPEYVVDASYRNVDLTTTADVFTERWLFEDCPGYARVAGFGPNPFEHDETQTPNWNGRVSAVVLHRTGAPGPGRLE